MLKTYVFYLKNGGILFGSIYNIDYNVSYYNVYNTFMISFNKDNGVYLVSYDPFKDIDENIVLFKDQIISISVLSSRYKKLYEDSIKILEMKMNQLKISEDMDNNSTIKEEKKYH